MRYLKRMFSPDKRQFYSLTLSICNGNCAVSFLDQRTDLTASGGLRMHLIIPFSFHTLPSSILDARFSQQKYSRPLDGILTEAVPLSNLRPSFIASVCASTIIIWCTNTLVFWGFLLYITSFCERILAHTEPNAIKLYVVRAGLTELYDSCKCIPQ